MCVIIHAGGFVSGRSWNDMPRSKKMHQVSMLKTHHDAVPCRAVTCHPVASRFPVLCRAVAFRAVPFSRAVPCRFPVPRRAVFTCRATPCRFHVPCRAVPFSLFEHPYLCTENHGKPRHGKPRHSKPRQATAWQATERQATARHCTARYAAAASSYNSSHSVWLEIY
jgi:hypothetical protein